MSGTHTNSHVDTSRALNRDASPGAPRAAAEVENKLKEAQGNLSEAEERLMASTNAPAANPQTNSPSRQEAPRDTAAKVSTKMKEHTLDIPFTEHLPENVAGTLCYLLGWVSGFVFLLVDRRPFVRFHAAQSVAVFAPLSILLLALGGFFLGTLIPPLHGVLFALSRIVELGWLIAAVVLMLKASSGEKYRLPWASAYADRAAGHDR
jgi:uncharacterized membrane protein